MYFTWLDSNSWLFEIGEKRILVDPWLVGSLVFGNLPWLFKGEKHAPRPIPDRIDIILLSQGLEDHAHTPTLKQLDKNIPVVASPNAAQVARDLGYTQVTALAHGATFQLGDRVEIRAVPGSPIGPMLVENGYVIRDRDTNYSLYYEPHGYHSSALDELAPIDVVITPIVDLKLPLVGSIIQGTKSALELAERVRPQVMLPTAEAGDVTYEGLLISALKAVGNVEDFRSSLARKNLPTRVLKPQPGERFEVELERRETSVA
ncbi:MBL fold metallo-hydrolase [Lyngbya sp. CCY1209]|uniref:MBL fold metallo-hydrolase n=1 Tax=Lyngbya sp. CCY1209 TaxID=2886103 RepID=UPI002D215F07|nr:MBL fold metallo-hydrolase [Lyngbya sp. CCY1209]MEB3885083.1 MBL fold metallo-hydrolase [Lyngbya sp. CCY1209]